MITMFTGFPSGISAPSYWSDVVPAGAVHTSPSQGGVFIAAERRRDGKAQVRPFAATADALEGRSSGSSVWSPPI